MLEAQKAYMSTGSMHHMLIEQLETKRIEC